MIKLFKLVLLAITMPIDDAAPQGPSQPSYLPDLIAQFKRRLPENDDPKLSYTQGGQLVDFLNRGSYYMYEGCLWQRQTPSQLEVFTFGDPFGNGTSHTYSTIDDPVWFMQYLAACERRLNHHHPYVAPILAAGPVGGIVGAVAAIVSGMSRAEGIPLILKVAGLGILGAVVGVYYYSTGIADRYQRVDNTAVDKSRATRWTGRKAIDKVLESIK